VPAITTKAELDALFSFSASLGTGYSGNWTSLSELVITLTDVHDRTDHDMAAPLITSDDLQSNDAYRLDLNDHGNTAHYQFTRVGLFNIGVKFAGGLQSADLSSDVSNSSFRSPTRKNTLQGSWGDHTAPAIGSVEAVEYGKVGVDLDEGDVLVIRFDQPTNLALAPTAATSTATGSADGTMTKEQVDALFDFSAPIGSAYTAAWTSFSVLLITIGNATGAVLGGASGDAGSTAVGVLQLSVRDSAGLRSTDLSSPNSTATALLGGAWGRVPDAPTNLAASANATHATIPLRFQAPANGGGADITHYMISYSAAGVDRIPRIVDASSLEKDSSSTYLLYELGELEAGVPHTISVRAMSYFGYGAASANTTASTSKAGAFYFKRVQTRRTAESTMDYNQSITVQVTVSRYGGAEAGGAVFYTSSLGHTGKLSFGVAVVDRTFEFPVDLNATSSYAEFPTDSIKLTLSTPLGAGGLGYPSESYVSLPAKSSLATQFGALDSYVDIEDAQCHFDFGSVEAVEA
jgi:hypothetical protein